MKDPRYQLYQPLGESLTRLLRRGMGLGKKKFGVRDALTHAFRITPELIGTLDFAVLAEEHYWERQGKHVLFPLPDLIDGLLGAHFQISNPEGFDWPYRSAMIALPSTGPLAAIPGTLITWQPYKERSTRITQPFLRWIGQSPIQEQATDSIRIDDTLITIAYRLSSPGGHPGVARSVFTLRTMPELLKAETARDYLDCLGEFEVYDGDQALTEGEAEIQLKLLRLVAGLALMYRIAPQEFIQPGLPGIRFAGAGKLPKGAKPGQLIVPRSAPEVPKSRHHRRWHLRTLMAQRYYRGEHANKPRGSRVIFVHDAVIGANSAGSIQNDKDQ